MQAPSEGVSTAAGWLRRAARGLRDLALPPVCFVCERPLAGAPGLCMGCWADLRLIERPYCENHGTPLAYDLGPGALGAEAIADPPPFERARAVCAHDAVARSLVHGFKYRDRLEIGAVMADWMARAGAELLRDAQAIVPVPLHRTRLWQRRFNQAAVLASRLGARTGKPVLPTALRRIRPTAHQVGLDAGQRRANVRGAFRVDAEQQPALSGRRILLVDDVYTTGATVKACTRALLRARATSVDVLTFARVVRDGNPPI